MKSMSLGARLLGAYSFLTRRFKHDARGATSRHGAGRKGFSDKRLRREMKRRFADHVSMMAKRDYETVMAFDERLIDAFAAFEITSRTKTRDVLHRAADLIAWLERVRPTSIQELGSGRSSLVFSLWAARQNIAYKAFEQSPKWTAMAREAIERLGGAGEILQVPVRRLNDFGNRFVVDIPEGTDFIYLDGPHGGGEIYRTYNGAPVNFDVAEHLGKGQRPRLILVDGRTETCRCLAGLPAAQDYELEYQFKALPQFAHETEIRRHTSLVLKTGTTGSQSQDAAS